MSSNNDIEKIFSSTFDDYQHKLDEASVWQDIEERLDHKKKRKFFFWIWPFGVFIIGLIMVLILPLNQDPASLVKVVNKSEALNSDTKTSKIDKPTNQDLKIEKTNITEDEEESRNERPQSKTSITATITTDKQNHKLGRSEEVTNAIIEHKTLLDGHGKVIDGEDLSGNQNHTLIYSEKSNPDGSEINEALESNDILRNLEVSKPSNHYANTYTSLENIAVNQPPVGRFLLLNKMEHIPLALFPALQPEVTMDSSFWEIDKIPLQKSKQNKFFIDVSAGGIRHFENISVRQSNEIESMMYLNQWNQSTVEIGGYAFNISAGKTLGRHFEFSLGLQFQRLISKFQRSELPRVEYSVVWDDQASYFIDENNSRVFIGGNVIQTEIYTKRIRAKQIHSLVNIPLQIGWSSYLGRTKFGLHAGPSLNIRQSFRGKVLGPKFETAEIDKNKIISEEDQGLQIYKSQVGVSWHAAFRVARGIGNKVEIFSELNVQYNPNDWMSSNMALKSKYHMLGANLGVRQIF